MSEFITLIAISLAYVIPGFVVSYALFPSKGSLSRGSRLVLSFGLSPGILTILMFLSYYILHSFENIFIFCSLALITLFSLILYFFQIKFFKLNFLNHSIAIKDSYRIPKPFKVLFVVGIFLIIVFCFYHALNFPIVSWDSLTEFAYLGRLYFQVNGIPTITGATLGVQSSANFPPMIPLLYTWFYKIYGGVEELFIKSVSPLYSVFTILATYAISKQIYKSRNQAWASIFFLTSVPIFMFISEDCLSDGPLMFYFTSSLYFLFISIYNNNIRNRAIIASGLLGGLAAWTKYTGLFLAFVFLAIFLIENFIYKKRNLKSSFSFKQLLLLIFFFTLIGAPWYIRNWIIVGNPVYPELYQFFGGKDIDPWLFKDGFEAHFAIIREISSLDLSPRSLLLTYFTVFFKIPPFEIVDMGPFLGAFTLIGLYFILRKREKADILIITWILTYFFIWRITTSTFIRYLSAILPALAILSSYGLYELYSSLDILHFKINFLQKSFSLKMILKALLFLLILEGMFLPTLVNSLRGYKTWAFVSPYISKDDYMNLRLPGWWEAINYINNNTPLNSVILTYDYSVGYYVNRTIIFVDEPRIKGIHIANSSMELMSVLNMFNISYILDEGYYKDVYVLESKSYLYKNLNNSNDFTMIFDKSSVLIYSVNR